MATGIPKRDDVVFIMIDIQEKFLPVIHNINAVIENSNKFVTASQILEMPLVVTEQYPKGLGKTVGEIKFGDNQKIIEKITFDCFGCAEFTNMLDSLNRKTLVIFGIEAHVCVLQTCLRAVENGYQVHIISDAVSSRTLENKNIAIDRMKQAGVFIASTEMILFQLMDRAGTDEFKAISKLVK